MVTTKVGYFGGHFRFKGLFFESKCTDYECLFCYTKTPNIFLGMPDVLVTMRF